MALTVYTYDFYYYYMLIVATNRPFQVGTYLFPHKILSNGPDNFSNKK